MKKVIHLFSILTCMLVLTGCGSDETENPYAKKPSITIDQANVLFECVASQGSIVCTAPNGITRVENTSSWCSTTVNGDRVSVSVSQNPSRESRSTKLKIYSGDDYAEVTVQQMGIILSVNNGNPYEINAAAGTYTIPINYSGSLPLSIESSSADWLTLSIVGNELRVGAKVNPSQKGRSAEATLTDGETTCQLEIQQDGITFIVNDNKNYVSNDAASSQNLKVSGTPGIQYEIMPSEVDWAKFSVASDGSINVTLEPNNTGSIRQTKATVVYAGELTYSFMVQQFEFEKDIFGTYTLAWGSKTTKVAIENLGNNKGQWRFLSGDYAKMGIVIPVTFDATDYSMTMMNIIDVEGTYTKDGVDYKLTTFIMSQKGTSIYRHNKPKLGMLGQLSVSESGTCSWQFTDNGDLDSGYELYGLRIGYGTGGYSGYVGNYVTFNGLSMTKDQ